MTTISPNSPLKNYWTRTLPSWGKVSDWCLSVILKTLAPEEHACENGGLAPSFPQRLDFEVRVQTGMFTRALTSFHPQELLACCRQGHGERDSFRKDLVAELRMVVSSTVTPQTSVMGFSSYVCLLSQKVVTAHPGECAALTWTLNLSPWLEFWLRKGNQMNRRHHFYSQKPTVYFGRQDTDTHTGVQHALWENNSTLGKSFEKSTSALDKSTG